MDDRKNPIRAIFRNEVTWIITFIGMTIGFFNMVVLPLQKVQLQLTQIQVDLSETKANYQQALKGHQSLTSRIDILETKVSPLLKK